MHEAGLRLEAGNHEDLGGRTHPFSLGSAGAEDLFDLALDLLEVHELSVNGREAYVRDLVQVAQAIHDHLADLPARDLDAPGARSSASMSSTIARSRSGEMSRCSVAFFSPVNSFCGSTSSRRPSFFVT